MALSSQRKAYVYAAFSVFLWSTVASAFKLSLRHMDPLQLLLWADIASIACLAVILCVSRRLHLLMGYSVRDMAAAAVLGFLNPYLYYIVLFSAYNLLPAQVAQPLNYTWAITLTLLAIPLLRQKIGIRDLGAIMISYFGVVLIATHGNPFSMHFTSIPGVALALGSTVIWALYWIYNARDTHDPTVGLFLNFLFALPPAFLTCYAFSTPWPPSLYGLAGAFYVGVFEMGIAFVFWLKALRLAESTARISTMIFFSPFLSLVFISILVGEAIMASTVFGLVFIIAGNILQRARFNLG